MRGRAIWGCISRKAIHISHLGQGHGTLQARWLQRGSSIINCKLRVVEKEAYGKLEGGGKGRTCTYGGVSERTLGDGLEECRLSNVCKTDLLRISRAQGHAIMAGGAYDSTL